MDKKRNMRINSEVQRLVYEIIDQRLKNPLISEMFSISGVEVTSDMKYAKIYVSVYSLDAEKAKSTFNAINDSAKQIRHELSSLMRTRTVPELKFILDTSFEYDEKINRLLHSVSASEGEDSAKNSDK